MKNVVFKIEETNSEGFRFTKTFTLGVPSGVFRIAEYHPSPCLSIMIDDSGIYPSAVIRSRQYSRHPWQDKTKYSVYLNGRELIIPKRGYIDQALIEGYDISFKEESRGYSKTVRLTVKSIR